MSSVVSSDTKEEENSRRVTDHEVANLAFEFSKVTAEEYTASKDRQSYFKTVHSPLASMEQAEAQHKRRQKALEYQKRNREDTMSKARNLALGIITNDNDHEEEKEEEEEEEEREKTLKRHRESDEEMEERPKIVKYNVKNKKKNTNKKRKNLYANQIMYAESMETIPEDFIDQWIMMICPKGKRCLVASGGGKTIARSKAGNVIARFQSILPNGSKYSLSSDYCILDCVYDAIHWTFYVLDIMCWKGYSTFDCDTNFRHYWLESKLQQNEMDKPTAYNSFYKFIPIKPVPTAHTKLVASNPEGFIATSHGYSYDIDGLLFYHKETHYTAGNTPLVCWVPRDDISTLLHDLS
ncbi:hypothetical protein BDB01DRAFT_543348 [Pilobolus umbonatus]|nr:hypothetical protein BDB01DRAFT_543348 [Pilobolus umbonatus]